MTSTVTKYEVGTTVHVDPTTLLLTRNIREAQPDADLIASVKAVGVLEPIVAVLTDDNGLLVRMGHRRTLAAVEAQTTTVPVYITGTDSLDTEAEVARIVAQRDENTHRAGLTTSDEVGIVEQLAAFGLSPAQIAKKTRIKRDTIDAALTVAGSTMAKEHAQAYTDLTLEQAATLAEFEDDGEAVIALINAAGNGQFDHKVQQLRDQRTRAALRHAVAAEAEAAGLTVIERPDYDDRKTKRLNEIYLSAEDKTRLTVENHAECPGHVVWIDYEWAQVDADGNRAEYPNAPEPEDYEGGEDAEAYAAYEAEYDRVRTGTRSMQVPVLAAGCTGWTGHGHVDRYGSTPSGKKAAADMSEEEREAAKAQRKLVIENNKAWSAAQPVRREFLASLPKAKAAPKGTARFLATALGTDPTLLHSTGGNHLAAELLGHKSTRTYGRDRLAPAKNASDDKCLLFALTVTLAYYEDSLTDATWRENGEHNACGRYLRFLATAGYGLSDVETYATSSETA